METKLFEDHNQLDVIAVADKKRTFLYNGNYELLYDFKGTYSKSQCEFIYLALNGAYERGLLRGRNKLREEFKALLEDD